MAVGEFWGAKPAAVTGVPSSQTWWTMHDLVSLQEPRAALQITDGALHHKDDRLCRLAKCDKHSMVDQPA